MQIGKISEPDLVARAQDGDSYAIDRLCNRYRKEIFAFLTRRFGRTEHADDIEDIAQETLIHVWLHIDEFRGHCKLQTCLNAIAKRQFRNNYLTVFRRRVPASKRSELHAGFATNYNALALLDLVTPDEHLDATERLRKLDMQWSTLPQAARKTFVLCTFDQMSYKDTARRLRIPLGTVRLRIHRVRARLGLR